jgi:anti-sigma regulatory factor (Ser/Thr protein kinase)
VRITDHGGALAIPEPQIPDLEAKLAGLQSPRGWGLFLIENMVDEMHVSSDANHHTVDLVLHLKGGKRASTGD